MSAPAEVCWRGECRTGCYYEDCCSLNPPPAPGVDECCASGRCEVCSPGSKDDAAYTAHVRDALAILRATTAPARPWSDNDPADRDHIAEERQAEARGDYLSSWDEDRLDERRAR